MKRSWCVCPLVRMQGWQRGGASVGRQSPTAMPRTADQEQTVLRCAQAVGGLAAPAKPLRGARRWGCCGGGQAVAKGDAVTLGQAWQQVRVGDVQPDVDSLNHASEVRAARWRPNFYEPICPLQKSAMTCMTHMALGALALSFSASAISSVLQYAVQLGKPCSLLLPTYSMVAQRLRRGSRPVDAARCHAGHPIGLGVQAFGRHLTGNTLFC